MYTSDFFGANSRSGANFFLKTLNEIAKVFPQQKKKLRTLEYVGLEGNQIGTKIVDSKVSNKLQTKFKSIVLG